VGIAAVRSRMLAGRSAVVVLLGVVRSAADEPKTRS
jgi:hypothetical protein